MNIAYSLNKEISGQKILKDITNLCSKVKKEELKNTCLVISLRTIIDNENNSIPLLENKDNIVSP